MLSFFTNHLADIIIGGLLLIAVAAIVIHLIKNKKHGKSSCGCGCDSCPAASACHKNNGRNSQ